MWRTSYLRPAIIGLLALAALSIIVSARDTAYATTFNPTISTTLADPTPGAASDIIGTFGIPQGDSNFGGVVAFTPPQWFVAADADVPNGAIVAELVSQVKLGLFGNTCSTSLTLSFNMMDASTDIADTISPLTNPPAGLSELEPLLDDADGNGFPDGVDKYPSFLNELFDPDDGGPLGPVQPRARMFGVAEVSTTNIAVILNFVLFDPGALSVFPDITGGFASGGYPSVTILNDPTAPRTPGAENTVTDFCSSLSVQTTTFGISKDNVCSPAPGPAACRTPQGDHLIGVPGTGTNPDEGAFDFRMNPSTAATYAFSTGAVSLWDADDDGIENPLDPCPLTPDPDWDPRSFFGVQDPGDKDADGLPDSCDPEPLVQSPLLAGTPGFNEDLDLYMNAADNCPLVPNDDQADEDSDGIGDACDPYPNDETNNGAAHRHEVCLTAQVIVGAGGADQTDTDGDGLADACDPTISHDLAVTSMAAFGPAPFSIADTTLGTYLWVVSRVANLATAAQHSTDTSHIVGAADTGILSLSVASTGPDVFGSGDCTKTGDASPFLGSSAVSLAPGASKVVVYRVRIDCTGSADTQPVLTVTFGIDHAAGPSGGDDTTTANDSDIELRQLQIVP